MISVYNVASGEKTAVKNRSLCFFGVLLRAGWSPFREIHRIAAAKATDDPRARRGANVKSDREKQEITSAGENASTGDGMKNGSLFCFDVSRRARRFLRVRRWKMDGCR